MTPQQESAVQVLRAWYPVEFFRTYAVPDKNDQHIPSVEISTGELELKQNFLLPWIANQLKPSLGLDIYKKTTYTLYLGLFNRSVLSQIAERICGFNSWHPDELEQRLDQQGWTCFAKLTLDDQGSPQFDSLSVSTLPWAIGHLLRHQTQKLSLSLFDAENQKLKETISGIQFALPPVRHNPSKRVLDADAIRALVDALYQWAGLSPEDLVPAGTTPEFLFQMEFSQQIEASDLSQSKPVFFGNRPDDEPEPESAPFAILNTAYLRDIERAIRCIERGTAGTALMQLLSSVPERYADLHQDQALSFIAEHFHPGCTPSGRWPSDISGHLSFMQQFAVNTTRQSLFDEGVISVNSPPGTGSAAMIQNIIAQNVVARAQVLAGLSSAVEGVTQNGFLQPALTGFEMVLAADHSDTVEHMTRELSGVCSLAKCYQDLSYFRPVAHQLNAFKHKNRLQPLEKPEDRVWGTIATVLGTKQKREDFCERVFQENFWKKEPPIERDPAHDYLNLWQFKRYYTGPSFESAKQQFQQALTSYEALSANFMKYEELQQVQEQNRQLQISLKEQLTGLKHVESELRIALARHEESITNLNREIESGQTQLETIYPEQPGFFARLFNLESNRHYQHRLQHQLDSLTELKQQLDNETCTAEEHQHEQDVNLNHQIAIERQYEEIKTELVENQQILIQIREQLKECKLPGDALRLTDPEVQQQAFWHNRKTNQLRSEVFITAMTLHQAWLMEALEHPEFAAQFRDLENLLMGSPAAQKGLDKQALWQILFILTPVISTTLPAMSRMFAGLPEQSLGWVMIQHAGAIEPQAAIGALMRAKRGLILGDRLQSKPPLTAPPQLMESLLSASFEAQWASWHPANYSLQRLVDRVNPYGCLMDVSGQPQWVGIPFWVHRGCDEPMFSLANHIAYHERLIRAKGDTSASRPHRLLGKNRWIHTPGRCIDKQYKQEISVEVLTLLCQAATQPDAVDGIYILSPFKAIVSGVRCYLNEHRETLCGMLNWDPHMLDYFLYHHIGTIHQFQGKSNQTVILLLGCDIEKRSSAEWFSSTPNLMNVALTCARHHFFVIGDVTVWADKPYVEPVYRRLRAEEGVSVPVEEPVLSEP